MCIGAGAHRVQNRVPDELELQAVVNYVDAGNRTQSYERAAGTLTHWALSSTVVLNVLLLFKKMFVSPTSFLISCLLRSYIYLTVLCQLDTN